MFQGLSFERVSCQQICKGNSRWRLASPAILGKVFHHIHASQLRVYTFLAYVCSCSTCKPYVYFPGDDREDRTFKRDSNSTPLRKHEKYHKISKQILHHWRPRYLTKSSRSKRRNKFVCYGCQFTEILSRY